MNWTGGRLRRQSQNRPGSLTRIQKRHFAKAQQKQRAASQGKVASRLVPLADFCQPSGREGICHPGRNVCQSRAEDGNRQSYQSYASSHPVSESQTDLKFQRSTLPQEHCSRIVLSMQVYSLSSTLQKLAHSCLFSADWLADLPSCRSQIASPSSK